LDGRKGTLVYPSTSSAAQLRENRNQKRRSCEKPEMAAEEGATLALERSEEAVLTTLIQAKL
jgi:hypothetical protein